MIDPRDVDRQLLYGILALQNSFIDRPALIAAMRVWVGDRTRPLARVLDEQGGIDESAHPLLEALVAHHLRLHGDDSSRSLAALPVNDPELRQSLSFLESDQPTDLEVDPYATKAEPVVQDTRSTDLHDLQATGFLENFPSKPSSSRFRILHPHARGGLGQVSVAMDEELGRQVALKEIQDHHADQPEFRSRFVKEAEITGKLEHPGIIPIYGLGHHADGRPYYAMRFIRGDNLDATIAAHHRAIAEGASPGDRALQLRELLGRFLDVCDAVAYAHSRRVIHRDIKPGNILLGPFGETLVVDWGLAKLLEDPEDAVSSLGPVRPSLEGADSSPTVAGIAHGTPAYMSPEQAEGRLDLIGPASDVYSLGATLYQILAGRPPFGGPDVISKVILGDFSPPRKIREAIPRALEAVCLRAMATRIGDRYASVKDLADDLKLWLADEPVSAFAEPISARVRRWTKRHRNAVTAAVAMTLISIVALGVSGLILATKNQELSLANQGERQARQSADRDRLQADRARANAEAAQARALASAQLENLARIAAQEASERAKVEATTAGRTKDFLVEIFTDADPLALFAGGSAGSSRKGKPLTAVELLEKGARKVGTDLKDEPLVRASLMEAIGNALRSKVQLSQAEPLLRDALKIRQAQLPANDLAIADSLESVGWLFQDLGKTAEALEQFQQALAIRNPQLGKDDPRLARVLFHIAWVLAEEGRMAEAEPLFRQVIQIREAHPGAPRDLAIARVGLAALLVDSGRNVQALGQVALALQAQFSEEGMEGGMKAVTEFQKGVALKSAWPAAAEQALRNSLKASTNLLGDDHPYNAFAHYTLAGLFDSQRRFDEAETHYKRCLEICRGSVGMGYPRVGLLVWEFARFLEKRDRRPQAVALFEEMILARRQRFSPDHLMLAEGLVLQAQFFSKERPARLSRWSSRL